jgi:hypothetical protein
MEFLSGFKWAVPVAFVRAVAECHFKEGDILYDSARAYSSSLQSTGAPICSLQVRSSLRASNDSLTGSRDMFSRNWESEVHVDIYRDSNKLTPCALVTTQGRIYTTLWKDNVVILDPTGTAPDIPQSVTRVTKLLANIAGAIRCASHGGISFVMAHDISNHASSAKYLRLRTILEPYFRCKPERSTPQLCGINSWETIAPTVEIVAFRVTGLTSGELNNLIRDAVCVQYGGSIVSQFHIRAHGIIVPAPRL